MYRSLVNKKVNEPSQACRTFQQLFLLVFTKKYTQQLLLWKDFFRKANSSWLKQKKSEHCRGISFRDKKLLAQAVFFEIGKYDDSNLLNKFEIGKVTT